VTRAMKLSSVMTMITDPLIVRSEPLHLDWRLEEAQVRVADTCGATTKAATFCHQGAVDI